MNKQEIQALINAKIAGQGNQVDIGGALAEILTELVNASPEQHILEILQVPDNYRTEDEVLALLKLDGETPTKEQLSALRSNCMAKHDVDYYQLLFNSGGSMLFGYQFQVGYIDAADAVQIVLDGDLSYIKIETN